jgi:hypothetical protein
VSTEPETKRAAVVRDDQLESARQILAGSPDRGACASALQQINGHFATHPQPNPTTLSPEQKELLRKHFGLDDGELAEVESTNYTLLDAPYLEFCFLMRDVARSLDVDNLSPAERAAAAFAWVTRQVVVQDGEGELPPEFVLRRGWGSGLERAYVFLALLRQLDIPGGLMMTPGSAAPWGCGALVAIEGDKQKQVLLFDHRLGLPLPGGNGAPESELARAYRLATPIPGSDAGRQIATLAALRKQPDLLKPFTTDEKQPYDVGAEQVKDARARLAVPVSALAPRMRMLQDDLLTQKAGVRLATDPAQLVGAFASAGGVEGGADAVRAREGTAGVLRRFLSEREGGVDKEDASQRARLALIPRNTLPRQLTELGGAPGQHILARFAAPFIFFQLEPGSPRDLVLRGQYKEAMQQLAPLREQFRVQQGLLRSNPQVFTDFERWKEGLYKAYKEAATAQDNFRKGAVPQEAVDQAMAQRQRVEKDGEKILSILVDGTAADPRLNQATYQLALCMQEQAERVQARAEHLGRAKPPADAQELTAAQGAARSAWMDAAGWWDTYIQSYPGTAYALHGQVLYARARQALGERDRALALMQDEPAGMSPQQKRARACLAQSLKAP